MLLKFQVILTKMIFLFLEICELTFESQKSKLNFIGKFNNKILDTNFN
jgi:hypothetical protein